MPPLSPTARSLLPLAASYVAWVFATSVLFRCYGYPLAAVVVGVAISLAVGGCTWLACPETSKGRR